MRSKSRVLGVWLGVALASGPAAAQDIAPEADAILKAMSEHLAALGAFSVTNDASVELILGDGRKLQFTGSGAFVMDRARGFRFERLGPVGPITVAFDGSTLALALEDFGAVLQLAVDGGNDAAFDAVRDDLGIEAAGGVDLLYSDVYGGLMTDVTRGDYIGQTWIGGSRVHHLSYRAEHVDWQLWVQADGEPLPLKYVITSKWLTGAPQFTVQLSDWDTDVVVSESALAFVPSETARVFDVAEFKALLLTE